MRRLIASLVLVAASLGLAVAPAAADPPSARIVLSFDFSDNSAPPAVSNGVFHIATDVLPEGTRGVVRLIAIAPTDAGDEDDLARDIKEFVHVRSVERRRYNVPWRSQDT